MNESFLDLLQIANYFLQSKKTIKGIVMPFKKLEKFFSPNCNLSGIKLYISVANS